MSAPGSDLVAALADAEAARADLSEVGGDWAVVDGVACLRVPVKHAWAVQAKIMFPPTARALDAVMRWMGMTTERGRVMTRRTYAHLPVFTAAGLRPTLELAAMAQVNPPDDLRMVDGLEICEAASADEVRSVLCAFDADLGPLVTDAHLRAASYHHLVARLAGATVACAHVRWAAGTGYVSGVTVLPHVRNLGVGSAISAAAAAEARSRTAGPVWLHAQERMYPLYQRLGFRVVDLHVQLGLDASCATATAAHAGAD